MSASEPVIRIMRETEAVHEAVEMRNVDEVARVQEDAIVGIVLVVAVQATIVRDVAKAEMSSVLCRVVHVVIVLLSGRVVAVAVAVTAHASIGRNSRVLSMQSETRQTIVVAVSVLVATRTVTVEMTVERDRLFSVTTALAVIAALKEVQVARTSRDDAAAVQSDNHGDETTMLKSVVMTSADRRSVTTIHAAASQ